MRIILQRSELKKENQLLHYEGQLRINKEFHNQEQKAEHQNFEKV